MKRLMLTILLILCCSHALQAQPWIRDFNTITPPVIVSTAAELSAALSVAQPGHKILLKDGTYPGLFTVSRSGTAANAILITAENHAIVTGGFKITAAHNYVFGIEITGGPTGGGAAIDLLCSYCGAINNVIHGRNGDIGIGAWNNGPGQVIYGNIIWTQIPNGNNPHNIYTQNDPAVNGIKYFIQNYSADSSAATSNTFNFHGYAEGNKLSGLHVEKCIFANGRWLIGGWNEPHYKEVVKESYFYNSQVQFGFKRPIQFQAEDCYFGKSPVASNWLWGFGEVQFPNLLTEPSIFRRNKLVNAAKDIEITTSAYTTVGRQECVPKFRTGEIFDENFFAPDFDASLCVGNVNAVSVGTLDEWRTWTLQRGGVQFDTNSTESSTVSNEVAFIQNEYDPTKGFLVVYNWENLPSVQFSKPGSFAVHKIKDPFGPPIVTGSGSVSIPLTSEFETFLVKASPDPPAPACPDTIEELRNIRKDLGDRTIQCQPKVKRCKQELDALILLLEECE